MCKMLQTSEAHLRIIALGFYWACSSLIGGIIQAGVTEFYGPYKMIAKQQAKAITTEAEKEEKYLSKHE